MDFFAGDRIISVNGGEKFQYTVEPLPSDHGIEFIRFSMHADEACYPDPVTISWKHPAVDIHGYWDPTANRDKGIRIDFSQPSASKATFSAPVFSLYNSAGANRLTVALSDALRPMQFRAGIHEESAQFEVWVKLFTEASPQVTHYEVVVRVDTRDIFYAESLREVSSWWEGLPGYTPSDVPEAACLPMYSTWYSFHQQVNPDEIEQQCLLAKELGCKTVIVDDGWQTANDERGYAFCGDWQVSSERIDDMKQFVERVHDAGMKFMLWYSVPFVGVHSQTWKRFEGKYINTYGGDDTAVLDPRFPEVREYLIHIYEQALHDWEIDGFKLDFVDSFLLSEEMRFSGGEGRDYDSVPEAVDRLLTDVMARLRAIKPDVMVEFRQNYIGPLMRKYGNMFRVADCPNHFNQNRIGSLDIRLLGGNTAVHSDMMMWNKNDHDENVALQFIHSLFSVPQISVRLDEIPDTHKKIVAFWLEFWKEHRQLLLEGTLRPMSPEMMYPIVYAYHDSQWLAAVYGEHIAASVDKTVNGSYWFVNGTSRNQMIVNWAKDAGDLRMIVRNCRGLTVKDEIVTMNRGVCVLEVPPSGLIEMICGVTG